MRIEMELTAPKYAKMSLSERCARTAPGERRREAWQGRTRRRARAPGAAPKPPKAPAAGGGAEKGGKCRDDSRGEGLAMVLLLVQVLGVGTGAEKATDICM